MRVLVILFLNLVFVMVGTAQEACRWGIKLYVRDEAGKILKDARVELLRVSEKNYIPKYKLSGEFHFWISPDTSREFEHPGTRNFSD